MLTSSRGVAIAFVIGLGDAQLDSFDELLAIVFSVALVVARCDQSRRLLAQALDGQRVGQLPSEAFELRMPGDIRCLERIELGECAAELGGEPAHIGRDLGQAAPHPREALRFKEEIGRDA